MYASANLEIVLPNITRRGCAVAEWYKALLGPQAKKHNKKPLEEICKSEIPSANV